MQENHEEENQPTCIWHDLFILRLSWLAPIETWFILAIQEQLLEILV